MTEANSIIPDPDPSQVNWWEDPAARLAEPAAVSPKIAGEIMQDSSESAESTKLRIPLELAPIPAGFSPIPQVEVNIKPEYPDSILPWVRAGLPLPSEEYGRLTPSRSGWKLHLNFDPHDTAVVQQVRSFLDSAVEAGQVTQYKIGSGGGAESQQPGKESTVYVGHRDKAQAAAQAIEAGLGAILLGPTEATLQEDLPLTGKVMGRFDVDRVDPDFVQYGGHGVPMLYEDIRQVTLPEVEYEYNGLTGTEARTAFWEDALARVPALLAYRYGEFFTGSDPAAADALLRRAPASTAPWWQ